MHSHIAEIYNSKEEAKSNAKKYADVYVTTTKIEWEE